MSLLDRRSILLAPLALAACGFTPVYGPGGSGSALRNRVLVDEPDDRNGYLLTREIEERLGRPSPARFGLAVTIATVEEGLAIDPAGNTTRFNLLGAADFALRDLQGGQIVTSGRVENFTGYSATGTTVATLASAQDAQERLMRILAEQIIARLYAAQIPA
ncbi:hypothetical protein BOO69_16710 [Sulfitobacter alexandrii]|uniref:LPS-assembly lipoprotein n=1 Tax=Sulfitobacter alexandrii TaxID=1917485 RepID=A0A1J0WKL6_9RHOB|nr:LPS assembly lipoprotein LptE [Sulfitobacter alexandrii]APE44860.1 hypothetical protein BOO69_16710 [Sulfitobacter alexandrii]